MKVSRLILIPNSVSSDSDKSIYTFEVFIASSFTKRIDVLPSSETESGVFTTIPGKSLSSFVSIGFATLSASRASLIGSADVGSPVTRIRF